MAISLLNNLYPPIISTYMPAFIRTNSCRVYFSLSDYNSSSDIANVQVIVSYQNSSLTALDTLKYPTGVMIADLQIDTNVSGDSKYYIFISPSDLQDGEFAIGEYYKVQLRFTSTSASTLTDTSKIAAWLTANQEYFSEWSTVCLIRGIEQPSIYLRQFENATGTNDVVFSSSVLQLVGGLYYELDNSNLEDEYLKQYTINIYNASTGILLYNSGIIYTNEFYPNEINYTLDYAFEDGIKYLLELEYTTNNLYIGNVAYYFSVITAGVDVLYASITATSDPDNGRIVVNVKSTTTDVFFGNLCIRRASSEDNFQYWQDIKIQVMDDGSILDYIWYDYTAQSGIYYKYCAQSIDAKGYRGSVVMMRHPVMLYLDDMFLTREDFQLKIKYNPSISSFKINYNESKTDTIGSQYPYIRRNGNIAYKTFPISGLITAFCDEDNVFTSREDFYQDLEEYYDSFNDDEQITPYKDFIYEKFFRDKVMSFLYENNVKLFKSLTEGNILVRLMDVSFTPNSTLGRMLYTFSATAYEIDECSIDNYNKYGILTLGECSDFIEYQFKRLGQYSTIDAVDVWDKSTNFLDYLQDYYGNEAVDGYINNVKYLSWLRIEFQSEPYLIKCGSDGSLTIWNGSDFNDDVVLGYIIYINGVAILVSSRGYYELNDEDTVITSLYFINDEDAIIDYYVEIYEDEDVEKIANTLYYKTNPGQLWGVFDVDTSIFNEIYLKYYEDYSTFYQKIISINRMTVEAEPGTIVYVKDSFDDDYYRHEVGDTGILDFYDDEAIISAAYFRGVHLNEMTDETRKEPEDTQYRDTGITVDSLDEIENPGKNEVYTLSSVATTAVPMFNTNEDNSDPYLIKLQSLIKNGNRYIYYHNDWYIFTDDNDVLCPVIGLVDYIYEVVKGEY